MRHLGVVGNVFTGLEGLENKIPLYESLLLDEAKGTSTGIQIAFENGIVKSIWTNEGAKLPKWPAVPDKSAAIAPGDDVSSIYSKLARMKELGIAAKKLERISLFKKDVASLTIPAWLNRDSGILLHRSALTSFITSS